MSATVSFKTTDYKAMYEGLYLDVARLLVNNDNMKASTLLIEWDMLRVKYDNEVIESDSSASPKQQVELTLLALADNGGTV